MIRALLQVHPHKRPSANEILSWFSCPPHTCFPGGTCHVELVEEMIDLTNPRNNPKESNKIEIPRKELQSCQATSADASTHKKYVDDTKMEKKAGICPPSTEKQRENSQKNGTTIDTIQIERNKSIQDINSHNCPPTEQTDKLDISECILHPITTIDCKSEEETSFVSRQREVESRRARIRLQRFQQWGESSVTVREREGNSELQRKVETKNVQRGDYGKDHQKRSVDFSGHQIQNSDIFDGKPQRFVAWKATENESGSDVKQIIGVDEKREIVHANRQNQAMLYTETAELGSDRNSQSDKSTRPKLLTVSDASQLTFSIVYNKQNTL